MTGKQRKWREILPVLSLAIFGLIWMVPMIWTLLAAFVPTTELLNDSPLVWLQSLHLGAFEDAWQVAPFSRYYLNTFIFVFGLLAIQLVTISLADLPWHGWIFGARTRYFSYFSRN